MKDAELESMELDLRDLLNDIKKKKYDLIFDATGLQPDEISIDSFWTCPKSPIGYCVYDNYEDPSHDNCVFCHHPQERK